MGREFSRSESRDLGVGVGASGGYTVPPQFLQQLFEAQLAYGDCLVKTKKFDKATAALSEGLKWGPKWRPRFLVALGGAAMARDSLREAGIYFTRAREEAPADPEVRRALGDFYIQRGTWALAVIETQAAVDLDSSDVELHFSLAQALEYDERYDQALEQYRWITQRDADFAPAHLALGSLLYRAGANDPRRYTEARAPLERYTQLSPQDAKGWSLLARTRHSWRGRKPKPSATRTRSSTRFSGGRWLPSGITAPPTTTS